MQQQPYGAPPPMGGMGPPNPPSLGYVPGQVAPVNMAGEAELLRKAMKGFGTDEKELIRILSRPDALQMAALRSAYQQRFSRNLIADIESETRGYFQEGLVELVRGPLTADATNVNKSVKGLGTKETMLDDVLCGRSNADMNAIKAEYQNLFKRSMEQDVRDDLSGNVQQMYTVIMSARRNEDSAPYDQRVIDQQIESLHKAAAGGFGRDSMTVCQIIVSSNDGQLRALSHGYQQKYGKPLETMISSEFSFHMKDALLLFLARGSDKVKSDANQLEDSMKGLGTKDVLLVQRVVRAHWDKQHMGQVRNAYKVFHKRDLVDRIKGETRGDYERLMVACVM